MKNILFLLIFGLYSGMATAAKKAERSVKKAPTASTSYLKGLNFNLGSHTEFYNGIQNDSSGGLRKFDFAPTIGVGTRIPLGASYFNILPEVNWVLPRFNEDSKIMKNIFMLRADVSYDLLSWLRLRLGTSIMWLNQHGRGGTTSVNNGNTESTFYYPDENRSSLNNTLDFGIEALMDQFAIRFQTYTYSIFKAEQKQISYSLLLTYYWEKK